MDVQDPDLADHWPSQEGHQVAAVAVVVVDSHPESGRLSMVDEPLVGVEVENSKGPLPSAHSD